MSGNISGAGYHGCISLGGDIGFEMDGNVTGVVIEDSSVLGAPIALKGVSDAIINNFRHDVLADEAEFDRVSAEAEAAWSDTLKSPTRPGADISRAGSQRTAREAPRAGENRAARRRRQRDERKNS